MRVEDRSNGKGSNRKDSKKIEVAAEGCMKYILSDLRRAGGQESTIVLF